MSKEPQPAKHPTASAPARPAKDSDGPQEQPPISQADLDMDLPKISREDAEQLLRAGHRLRRRGDKPANWIAMTRHGPDLGLTVAATQDVLDLTLSEDLVLAE